MEQRNSRPAPPHLDIDFVHDASNSDFDPYNMPIEPPSSPQTQSAQPRPVKPTKNRARNESRKLISHVLLQLANRPKPRTALEAIINPAAEGQEGGIGALAQSLKYAVKGGLKSTEATQYKRPAKVDLDDSDDEAETTFSTDETFNLMSQLKDVLLMSFAQGWRIFDDEPSSNTWAGEATTRTGTSASRQSRSSIRAPTSRLPSASPSYSNKVHIPELLALCVSVLGSVVLEDCRYKILAPRPSRPPNALQSLTLSVAQFLIHHHGRDPQVISQISIAMIPAFYTFPESMYARLLTFFESSVIGIITGNLEQLSPLHLRPAMSMNSPQLSVKSAVAQDHSIISIHVDEVAPESGSIKGVPHLDLAASLHHQIQSTNNPDQSLTVYRLASLIPPLFNAIFDTLQDDEYSSGHHGHWDRVVRLLRIFSAAKLDLYNDILEIVAYHTPKARRGAIAALSAVWPRAVGHSYISGPFCPNSPHHADGHQFVSWYFASGNRPSFSDASFNDCKCCSRPINGFGLKCPLCFISIHFDCYDYPSGNYQIPYTGSQKSRTQRIAMFRYSISPSPQGVELGRLSRLGHRFQANTWFTITLCYSCKLPLWGCLGQGFWCPDCSAACHAHCLPGMETFCSSTSISLAHLSTKYPILRETCVAYYPILKFPPSQLKDLTFEEAGTYLGILRIQLQHLTNGLAMGSIIIDDAGADPIERRRFELHDVIDVLDEIVRGNSAIPSPSTQQYLDDNHISKDQRPLIIFDWSFLCYIATCLKASVLSASQPVNSDYLTVHQPLPPDSGEEPISHPQEARSSTIIREILKVEFGIRSEDASQLVLNHMLHASLIDLAHTQVEEDPIYTFPLPLGLDLSVNVETLVSAIEACFSDLDLSSNEFGFLLLTKRLWPNGLMSDYALKRLAEKVLFWILDEDHNLAIVLREYVATQRALPGVSLYKSHSNWPFPSDSRLGAHANNGGDYVAARRSLHSRYAVPWLRELHDLDTDLYTSIIVDVCSDSTRNREIGSLPNFDEGTNRIVPLEECDQILRYIVKLSQNFVLFSSFDHTFLLWMEKAVAFGWEHKYMPSLQRLFAHENETLQTRSSAHLDTLATASTFIDPLQAIINLANQADDGLTRSLRCLLMCIRSGAVVPTQIFLQFLSLISTSSPHCLQDASILTECVMLSLWIRTLGRQELQTVISQIHEKISSRITACLVTGMDAETGLRIIRQSLASCLRIYGCDRNSILSTGIVIEDEVRELPSRRKTGNRASRTDDPVFVQPKILEALQSYLDCNVEEVSCLLIHFFHAFLMESPFLEAFEVDNFILRNGKLITSCVWKAYGIQRDEIALARTNLLLRSLLVDGEPFQDILLSTIHGNVSTEVKLLNLNHLFRMVSDVTSPAFGVEGRQWRSSVVEIFYHYLSALWQDSQEEVRLSVRASMVALLPAHFELISQCWRETLLKAPIAEKLRLLSFLMQLHPHFPNWKRKSAATTICAQVLIISVVPWDAIIDTLAEYDFDPKGHDAAYENYNGPEKSEAGTMPNDIDLLNLKVSCTLLSLQLLSNGVEIDGFSLMKIKVHLIQLSGFSRVTISPTPSGHSFYLQFSDIAELASAVYPCIEEMVHVVDAASYVDLPLPALGLPEGPEEKTSEALVGTIFIDSILLMISTLKELQALPVLTLKSVLESLYILVHKYDLDHPTLKHFHPLLRRAVLRTAELIGNDISYELRQVSLSVCSAAIKKWHNVLGPVVTTILELVGIQISSETLNAQDPLMAQGKQLIYSTLQTFHSSGLLVSLMKAILAQVTNAGSGKDADTGSLAELLLRDVLSRAPEVDSSTYQTVLNNISRFIRIVYYQSYTSDLLSYTGQQLTSIARRLSDGSVENPDPSPIIATLSTLLQHNKKNAKEKSNANGQCQALIEALSQQRGSNAQTNIQSNLMWDACNYLHHHAWMDDFMEQEFDSSTAIAKLILQTGIQDPISFQRCIELPTEKTAKLSQILRSWNIMLFTALDGSHDEWKMILLDHFSIFNLTFSMLFKGYAYYGITSLEVATTDVNQGHIAMKLWMTLVHLQSQHTTGGERMISSVWSELWSAYEGFLNVLETEAQVPFYATLISLTSSSMADLFIYMRSLRTSIALDTAQHISVINRLRTMTQGDSTFQKVSPQVFALQTF
ncbi:hypothetical protein CVT24_010538 [Panaeolus cyanescens]|uniref:Phorbol-ester/DAG-type domain-containing protein n=1 Tax=Panaeolus cyanescens TaxID=181874 RepID=A0A409YYI2_9AGAR|nr:hypothetical protein CVT24_010538 [Panaeolus cyanescens]